MFKIEIHILSHNYLTVQDKKIAKSKNSLKIGAIFDSQVLTLY
jgi:hypothetical protein